MKEELARLGITLVDEDPQTLLLYRGETTLPLSPLLNAVSASLIQANQYRPPKFYLDEAGNGMPSLELAVNDELEMSSGQAVVDTSSMVPLFRSDKGYFYCDCQDRHPDDPTVFIFQAEAGSFQPYATGLRAFLQRLSTKAMANALLAQQSGCPFDDISLYCLAQSAPPETITELGWADAKIHSLRGIGLFSNARKIWLTGNQVEDIAELATLTQLRCAFLQKNRIRDIRSLSHCLELENLDLSGNPLQDLTPLGGLKKLLTLNLNATQVMDITPVGELKALATLTLEHTAVSDISVLARLTQLHTVHLQGTAVQHISPLRDLPKLNNLTWQGACCNPWSGTWNEETKQQLFG